VESERLSCGTLPGILSAFDSNRGSACAMIIGGLPVDLAEYAKSFLCVRQQLLLRFGS